MNINSETILSIFAVLSGFGAVLLFINTNLFASPLTITFGILSFSALVFTLTYNSDQRPVYLVGLTIFSLGVIISLTFPLTAILSDTIGVAVILATLSVFFLTLNQLIKEDKITQKHLYITTSIVVILFVSIAIVDVTTGEDPEVSNIELLETPQASENSNEYKIGQTSISSTLPKRINASNTQNYAACVPNHNRTKIDEDMTLPDIDKDEKIIPVRTRYEGFNSEMIIGTESKDIYMDIPPIYDKSKIQSSTIVLRDDCNPTEFNDKVIILFKVPTDYSRTPQY